MTIEQELSEIEKQIDAVIYSGFETKLQKILINRLLTKAAAIKTRESLSEVGE